MWLTNEELLAVIRYTPILSIDLLVRDENQQVLLGLRKNRPAQGFWFVPGGRIQKNERLADAFRRVTLEELGVALEIQQARFLGVFEHIYPDNFSGAVQTGTHYVNLACQLELARALPEMEDPQHSHWQWWQVGDLLASEAVHPYTRAYFQSSSPTLAFKV